MTIDVLNSFAGDKNRNSVTSSLPASSLQPAPPRSSVRRSLFGEVNHEESMDFLKKELDAISKSQMERWNFDFINEKPLHDSNSSYEWTPVEPEEIVPKPYALNRLPYLCKNAAGITSCALSKLRENTCPDQPINAECHDMNIVRVGVEDRLCNPVTKTKKLTQTSIDDFMKAKKRPAACRKFCKLMKNDSVYNNNDNAKAGCGYVIGGEGGGGRSDDGVVCEGGGDGGDISGPHGVVSSVRTSRQCLDSDESKGCHKTIRYHHRPVQQPEPSSKKFRLSR